MSNYIPRGGHFKKTEYLEKCEQDLLREIRSPLSDYTAKRLFRAAERVRSAHLAVLRAKKRQLPYNAHISQIKMDVEKGIYMIVTENFRGEYSKGNIQK